MTDTLSDFRPDPHSATPPFRQLRRAIAADIAAGHLAPGEKLPSVRALAQTLGMAANTVAKVYKDLEAEGLVETHGRAGTTVSAAGAHAPRQVHDAVDRLALAASRAGLDQESVLALVRAALAR